VVDQFDYTYWRSNFGAVGIAAAGSGSGSAVAELLSSGSLIAPTPAASTSTQSIGSAQSPTVEAAVSDFGFLPLAFMAPSKVVPRLASQSSQNTTTRIDWILSLAGSAAASRDHLDHETNFDDSATSHADHCNQVDDLFASPDAGELVAVFNSFATLA
jgi:hypothetical protein